MRTQMTMRDFLPLLSCWEAEMDEVVEMESQELRDLPGSKVTLEMLDVLVCKVPVEEEWSTSGGATPPALTPQELS